MGGHNISGVETRLQILDAAIPTFSERGFVGASTREIAKRAGTSQGLLTYHFKNKDELWFAAADRLFEVMEEEFGGLDLVEAPANQGEAPIDNLRKFMRFSVKHPHLLKFVIEGGRERNKRSEYLIDKHVRPMYEKFRDLLPDFLPAEFAPHVFYGLMGACLTMFSVPAECEYLTGLDPHSDAAIDRHAQFIAQLFFPHVN